MSQQKFNNSSSDSKLSHWFQWNWSEDMDPKIAFIRALITWLILLFVYACFQFLWQIVNQASNYSGPVFELYPSSASNPVISRVSNWSVTITRGLVAVLIGMFISKIGHKKAVIFAFSMILISFPFILTPLMKQSMISNGMSQLSASEFSYGLFIVFRIFLAIGGTAITILQAPIIAKFFASVPRRRNLAIKLGSIPAQLAGILASLIFIDGIAKALAGSALNIANDWKLISAIVLIMVLVLFVFYLFIGMHFKLSDNSGKQTNLQDADAEQNKISWLLKQPKVLLFTIGATFSLYAGIEPGSGVLSNFWQTTTNNVNLTWAADGTLLKGSEIPNPSVQTVMLIWQMLYSASLFLGILTIGKWTNTKYSAAKFSGFSICCGSIFWAISFGLGAVGLGSTAIVVFVIIFGVLGSTCIFGAQTLTGLVPYRWGFTPKQITNYTGLMWTLMYVGYSILDILTSYVGTWGISANIATISDYVSNNQDVFNSMFTITDAEKISTAYKTIQKILLGTNIETIKTYVGAANQSLYNWEVIQKVFVNSQTLSTSFNNLQHQYIPQICVITIAPIVSGIIFMFVKRTDKEVPFTFKHFKENHMDFHNLKKISNKLFKTSLVIKEHEELI